MNRETARQFEQLVTDLSEVVKIARVVPPTEPSGALGLILYRNAERGFFAGEAREAVDTVYNTLITLTRAGRVTIREISDERRRYRVVLRSGLKVLVIPYDPKEHAI